MRILLLSDVYEPSIGGTENHVMFLADRLAALGNVVSVGTITPQQSLPVDPGVERTQDVAVHRLPSTTAWYAERFGRRPGTYHLPRADPLTSKALEKLFHLNHYDVVHAHNWIGFSALAANACPPMLWMFHDYGADCVRKTFTMSKSVMKPGEVGANCKGSALRKCCSCAREQYGATRGLILAASLHAARGAVRGRNFVAAAVSSPVARSVEDAFGVDVHIIPTFVDWPSVARARHSLRPDWVPAAPYAQFAGSLGPYKGVQILFEAYRRLRRDLGLVVCGTPHRDMPTQVPRDVTIELNVGHDRVMSGWAHSEFGIVPSVWEEPFGQSALEALALGKPVVASAVGGLKDVVRHEQNGLLVDAGDPLQLERAMLRLWAEDGLRARLSRSAARDARRYSVETVADQSLRLLEEAQRQCST